MSSKTSRYWSRIECADTVFCCFCSMGTKRFYKTKIRPLNGSSVAFDSLRPSAKNGATILILNITRQLGKGKRVRFRSREKGGAAREN